jgi:hypothetical protein
MQRDPDLEIVERARANSSIVLTFDLDFGDVLDSACSRNRARSSFGADLESGALILVDDTRYRVRKLPIGRAQST